MANLTINFDKKINTSLQKGDIVYFLDNGTLEEVGPCVSVASDRLSFIVDIGSKAKRPTIGDYFMFAKNNVINSSGLIGYQATIKIENDSTDFCELYAVNSETMFSSN